MLKSSMLILSVLLVITATGSVQLQGETKKIITTSKGTLVDIEHIEYIGPSSLKGFVDIHYTDGRVMAVTPEDIERQRQ